MVQLVEITGVLNEKGCIEIPIVLLAQTGIRTGEEVNLIYLAAGEKDYRNESREFMLKRAEEDGNDSGSIQRKEDKNLSA